MKIPREEAIRKELSRYRIVKTSENVLPFEVQEKFLCFWTWSCQRFATMEKADRWIRLTINGKFKPRPVVVKTYENNMPKIGKQATGELSLVEVEAGELSITKEMG